MTPWGKLTVCIPHLFLAFSHQSEILNNGIWQIFEFLKLQLKWLQFGCFGDLQINNRLDCSDFKINYKSSENSSQIKTIVMRVWGGQEMLLCRGVDMVRVLQRISSNQPRNQGDWGHGKESLPIGKTMKFPGYAADMGCGGFMNMWHLKKAEFLSMIQIWRAGTM